jgi:hypothetical protein
VSRTGRNADQQFWPAARGQIGDMTPTIVDLQTLCPEAVPDMGSPLPRRGVATAGVVSKYEVVGGRSVSGMAEAGSSPSTKHSRIMTGCGVL